MQSKNEKDLEIKYMRVLSFTEAQSVLSDSPYTAGQIRGALTRYYKKTESTVPKTFIELEEDFLPDFQDWWLEEDPQLHSAIMEGELFRSSADYLAFTQVWKAKVKNNKVISSKLNLQARTMLAVKNSLAHAMKATFSYAKRNEAASLKELSQVFPLAYANILPFTYAIQDGDINEIPIDLAREDLSRLIGAYLAGDYNIVNAAKNIRLIEQEEEKEK